MSILTFSSKKYKLEPTITPARLFELNYNKIFQLFPQLGSRFEYSDNSLFNCNDRSLSLKLIENHKYTSFLLLYRKLPFDPPEESIYNYRLNIIEMRLHLYHDAKMIEVVSFQSKKKLKKYEYYPNKDMYMLDEKKQLNFHLKQILDDGLTTS